MDATGLRNALVSNILNPIMAALFVVAIIVFLWGIVEFLGYLGSDSEKKDKGKRHMIWGIVGLFIMTSAIAIVNFTMNTVSSVVGR